MNNNNNNNKKLEKLFSSKAKKGGGSEVINRMPQIVYNSKTLKKIQVGSERSQKKM